MLRKITIRRIIIVVIAVCSFVVQMLIPMKIFGQVVALLGLHGLGMNRRIQKLAFLRWLLLYFLGAVAIALLIYVGIRFNCRHFVALVVSIAWMLSMLDRDVQDKAGL